jgi:AraC-like DNA-binding protein
MQHKNLINAPALTHQKSLKTLVENRTVFSLDHCELNIFETYETAARVPLKFNDLVVTSMLRGKKVMHLFEDPAFEYLPGETVIVPQNVEMQIDFPEAQHNNPTQCIALAIDQQIIADTLNYLNEKYPKEARNHTWKLDYENYFFYNNLDLAGTINKLIKECMSNAVAKDAIVDLTMQELIVRIIQTQSLKALEGSPTQTLASTSPIAPAVAYIKENIHLSLNLKTISEKACMSSTSFYRHFKRELGVSPLEFILNEKIRFAKKLLSNPSIHITEVSYATGFDDANYFIRLFKKHEGVTPKQYQLMNCSA